MPNTNIPDIDTVTSLVVDQLREALSILDSPAAESADGTTPLVGGQAVLQSIDLVALIVDVEQRIADDYDLAITIADDRAMSQRTSPFRTPRSLAEYICVLLGEAAAA